MYEDRPEKDTPDWIQADLREYGGVAQTARLSGAWCWLKIAAIRCFGTMNHIAQDTSNWAPDKKATDLVPDRIEEGEFWIPGTE